MAWASVKPHKEVCVARVLFPCWAWALSNSVEIFGKGLTKMIRGLSGDAFNWCWWYGNCFVSIGSRICSPAFLPRDERLWQLCCPFYCIFQSLNLEAFLAERHFWYHPLVDARESQPPGVWRRQSARCQNRIYVVGVATIQDFQPPLSSSNQSKWVFVGPKCYLLFIEEWQ